jgi:DNA-binding CsgD family transcriptional regulator
MDGVIPDLDNVSLVCSIPLLDSAGNAFGVCGFDISEWNFNTRYLPDSSDYRDIACIFGPVNENRLRTDNAFITGRFSLGGLFRSNRFLPLPADNGLRQYGLYDGSIFLGKHNEAKLYPHDSPFSEQEYVLALAISKGEIDAINNREVIRLIIICLVLLILGLSISFIAGRRYLSPIESALSAIRAGDLDSVKTNIVELDELVGQVKAFREKGRPFPDDFYMDFIKRVGTLSQIERKIFDFFVDSASDNKVISAMFITKEALKKHSGRIYKKLGVNDKEALTLYIELMKMSGQISKITNHK